jgi:hypothetical protein
MTARLVTILWRDIPAQVVAKEGRNSHRVELPGRFQEAIDKAAVRAGLAGSDDYLNEWRRDVREIEGDPKTGADQLARELDETLTERTLAEMVANGGWKPSS